MLANYLHALRSRLGRYQMRSCLDKCGLTHEKLGTLYGGWYVPVSLLDSNSTCYCVGAGEDISFDIELINRFKCNVYIFDPTPRAKEHVDTLQQNTKRGAKTFIHNDRHMAYECTLSTLQQLHFYAFGLWSENTRMRFYIPQNSAHVSHSIVNLQKTQSYFEAECRTVRKLMHEFNHEMITLLKLDIEGAEYHVIDSLLTDAIYPTVLCVEFDEGHSPQDGDYLQRIRKNISKLKQAGYLVTYVDSWNVTFVQQHVINGMI